MSGDGGLGDSVRAIRAEQDAARIASEARAAREAAEKDRIRAAGRAFAERAYAAGLEPDTVKIAVLKPRSSSKPPAGPPETGYETITAWEVARMQSYTKGPPSKERTEWEGHDIWVRTDGTVFTRSWPISWVSDDAYGNADVIVRYLAEYLVAHGA